MAEILHISTYPELTAKQKQHKIPLVLLHGWGLNSAVWQPFIEQLTPEFTDVFYIVTLDLPGYGINIDNTLSSYSLANICQCIVNTITQPAIYLGWSLGGLVATEMALSYPKKVLGLITVASSPRFTEEMNEQKDTLWPGIKPKVLETFHQQLKIDTQKTISGFLKIQAMGSPHIRQDVKQLTALIFKHEMANKKTLDLSLKLLESTDFRPRLKDIYQPFLRLYGNADSLVPKRVISQVEALAQESEQYIFLQASHAPFISHADDFKEILVNWLLARFIH